MQKSQKPIRHAYLIYLIVIMLCVTGITIYTFKILKQFSEEKTVANLRAQASLLQELTREKLTSLRTGELNQDLKKIGAGISTRITVILPSGEVVADSHENIERLDSHLIRPEVKEALSGKTGIATRYSFTLNTEMIYLAEPVQVNDQVLGVVRTAVPASAVGQILRPFIFELSIVGMFLISLAATLILYLSYRIRKSMKQVQTAAVKFSKGDLQYRLTDSPFREITSLSESMNEMAAQLHQRLNLITQQRNELEAIFSAMVEAVLVLDQHERIIRANHSAERLFQVSVAKISSRTVLEAIRHTDLHRFVKSTFLSQQPLEREIILLGDPDVYLQAHGSVLRDDEGIILGALIVLHDISRLRSLENMRRDFVANVSHELKTPITSIKGFLETLKEGALNDHENAERFLDIAIKHTDRLNLLIEDLLNLSRIERDAEKGEIKLELCRLKEVFEAVEKSCREKASAKAVKLIFDIEKDLTASINMTLLEQAIFNLVDNAIKYSKPHGSVIVEAAKDANDIVIKVRDNGCGISKDHLARIFERFYRVDKARSRNGEGTGLGLAIVRHIITAHKGSIDVESSFDRGSTFSIHLPIEKSKQNV